MRLVFLFSFLFSAQALACNVGNYKDAIECIKEEAYKLYGEGELPHSIGVTRYDKGRKHFANITGIKIDDQVTYVGVVQVHYDEDQLLYFMVDWGPDSYADLVTEFNIVDIAATDVKGLEGKGPDEILKILSLEIPLVSSMKDFHY